MKLYETASNITILEILYIKQRYIWMLTVSDAQITTKHQQLFEKLDFFVAMKGAPRWKFLTTIKSIII